MAESQKCTIAELLGLSKHYSYMSNDELLWWQARSTMKPIEAVRQQIFFNDLITISNIHQETGKPMFKVKDFSRDWFAIPEADEWAKAKEDASREQKKINESLKDVHGN